MSYYTIRYEGYLEIGSRQWHPGPVPEVDDFRPKRWISPNLMNAPREPEQTDRYEVIEGYLTEYTHVHEMLSVCREVSEGYCEGFARVVEVTNGDPALLHQSDFEIEEVDPELLEHLRECRYRNGTTNPPGASEDLLTEAE